MNGKKLKFEALVSCLKGNPLSIVQNSNIRCDVLFINQCDDDTTSCFANPLNKEKKVRVINSKTRGLSLSRNIALIHSQADIVKLCDDDEYFDDDIEENILRAHESETAEIILFDVRSPRKKPFSSRSVCIKKLNALKFGSWQITFKLESVRNRVEFNQNFGSGAGIGSGEENIFLFKCLDIGLHLKYKPVIISHVSQLKSNWFKGYNDKYFFDKGVLSNELFGRLKYLYVLYFAIFKYSLYRADNSFLNALKNLYDGATTRLEN